MPPLLTVWLSSLIPMSSSMMVKNEAPYAASCSFFDWSEWFSPAAHLRKTDDNAVGVIYCDFTKMNMRSTFSSCKCGCAQKTSLLWMELFLQHLKERLAITDRKHSSLVNVNSPITITVTVIIICLGYNGAFNSVLSIVGPSWGLRWHCAATLWLIETYHHYWTVSAVT